MKCDAFPLFQVSTIYFYYVTKIVTFEFLPSGISSDSSIFLLVSFVFFISFVFLISFICIFSIICFTFSILLSSSICFSFCISFIL